jgi:hypothetical protein
MPPASRTLDYDGRCENRKKGFAYGGPPCEPERVPGREESRTLFPASCSADGQRLSVTVSEGFSRTLGDPRPPTGGAVLVFQGLSRSFRTREEPSSSKWRESPFYALISIIAAIWSSYANRSGKADVSKIRPSAFSQAPRSRESPAPGQVPCSVFHPE